MLRQFNLHYVVMEVMTRKKLITEAFGQKFQEIIKARSGKLSEIAAKPTVWLLV